MKFSRLINDTKLIQNRINFETSLSYNYIVIGKALKLFMVDYLI